jgi:hypothetical protein
MRRRDRDDEQKTEAAHPVKIRPIAVGQKFWPANRPPRRLWRGPGIGLSKLESGSGANLKSV